jgi:hypothetical protein
MNCPVCGAGLQGSRAQCAECGYSFSDPIELQADTTPPGTRPKTVVLAVELLAAYLALAVLGVAAVWIWFGLYRVIPATGLKLAGLVVGLRVTFIALIWFGVRWARNLFLLIVALHAAAAIWGFMAAMTVNQVGSYVTSMYSGLSIGLVVDIYVAWLLLQPETREWFCV